MTKIYILLIFLGSIVTIMGLGVPPCPIQYNVGSIYSAKIIVSNVRGLIPLNRGQEVTCYNYSLPYKFSRVPEIAIGVHQFEAKKTSDLYFAIKPLYSQSYSVVPFVIRTQWSYTQWTRIQFSFTAEDRSEIQSGYCQLDAGLLQGCQMGKQASAVIPFRKLTGSGIAKYSLFLNGFEISTQKYSLVEHSPFEIAIAGSSTNSSGITVMFALTTITQVHSIHLSYFAYYQTEIKIAMGSYVYDSTVQTKIEHIPIVNIGRNYARLHGITGFIINQNHQEISFDAVWTGVKFIFDLGYSQMLTKYLNYHYFFVMGSECEDCPGYPITHESRCVNVCPIGYFVTPEKVCMTCGDGQYWNGTACQKQCAQSQILNRATNECQCPGGLHWNGKKCISCNAGKIFNPIKNLCECGPGLRWNGYSCVEKPQCSHGKQWNIFTYTCQCPLGKRWNGTYCAGLITCYNGKILIDNECKCPNATFWNGNWCQDAGCKGGQKWDGTKCVCNSGLYFNGSLCIQCINGQVWNPVEKKCKCEKDYIWNGNFCEKFKVCTGNRVYNKTVDQCVCKDGQFWNGFACMVQPECCCGKLWNEKSFECQCPDNFNWDGNLCVQCINGKVWDEVNKVCICREGTFWNNQFCVVVQQCFGGMIWNQNTWTCQCPSTTVWKQNYCIENPCQRGKIWDNLHKQCICPHGRIYYDGACVPPQVSCKGGKIWNPTIYACVCPDGMWFNGKICVKITECKSNEVYNPLNNKCECQPGFVWLSSQHACGDPTCPPDQRWDGYGCIDISCPPGSYYNGTECICPSPELKCQPWQYYNGIQCVYFPQQCPIGTYWNKTACIPEDNGCPIGTYGKNNNCKPLPQRCGPMTHWVSTKHKCQPKTGGCPPGTYKAGYACKPYAPCQNGQKWDPNRYLCTCPQNTQWSGDRCRPCEGGKVWVSGVGCKCAIGSFYLGSKCEVVNQVRCGNIPNSIWTNNQCQCKQGFDAVGMQCLCEGVIIGDICDRCAYLPNSEWRFGRCMCLDGYTLHNHQCVRNSPGNDNPASCGVGTYYDTQQKKCLACPDGCLTCDDCYSCIQCSPQFNYDVASQLCIEVCGDGKKFVLECDDGNTNNNDGCTSECQIEQGYTCRGGSPENQDSCIIYLPLAVTLLQTGQIRYQTKMVLNIKIDYFPPELLQSEDCNDRCSGVIQAELVEGDTGAISISSKYLPGSSYSFSVEIDFGRSYIGQFTAELRINPALKKFFENVSIDEVLTVEVKPAFLSRADDDIL